MRRRGRARGTEPSRNHVGSRPRTIATGTPAALPITSSAAAAISSAIATSVTCSSRPRASSVPRRSTTAAMPGHADRDVGEALAPRPSERVGDDDRRPRRRAARAARRGCAGPSGRRRRAAARPTPRRRSTGRCRRSRTRTRARVSLMMRSPRRRTMRTDSDSTSARRAVEVVGIELHEPALGLRHDLLRDDEAVAVERGACPARRRRRRSARASSSPGRISAMPCDRDDRERSHRRRSGDGGERVARERGGDVGRRASACRRRPRARRAPRPRRACARRPASMTSALQNSRVLARDADARHLDAERAHEPVGRTLHRARRR